MSTNLSPAFVQLFEAEVHQAYQGAAVLELVTDEQKNQNAFNNFLKL